MNLFVVYFNELPKNTKYLLYFYIGSLFTYNTISTYIDSKNKLLKFRTNKLDSYQKINIKNEWDAVKYGASENFLPRLINSILWPINVISNVIPYIVLTFNKETPEYVNNKNKETPDDVNNKNKETPDDVNNKNNKNNNKNNKKNDKYNTDDSDD